MDDELRGSFRRDFTYETAGRPAVKRSAPPKPAPQSPPAPQHQPRPEVSQPRVSFDLPPGVKPHRQRKNRKKLVLVIILLIIIGSAAGGYWYGFIRPVMPVPASIRKSVSFPVLYPSQLPAGYQIKQSSFKLTQGAVVYEADNSDADKFIFSVQAQPPNFDFPTFYKKGLGGATAFKTPAGQAAIGTTNNLLLGSLASGTAWMLVTTPSRQPQQSDLKMILQNIKPAPATH